MLSVWCGQVSYRDAWRLQDRLHTDRVADRVEDVLLTLTHPQVYTAGRHADLDANLTGARPDIPLVAIDRGGDLTYHGPGQLVAYPIMRVDRGVKRYVSALEAAIIAVARHFGVAAERRAGYPGVWVGRDKLAAIGVRVSRGVSKHGLALNVDPDLGDYAGIVPCGIADGGVTSLAARGVRATVADVRPVLVAALADALDRPVRAGTPADIGLAAVAD